MVAAKQWPSLIPRVPVAIKQAKASSRKAVTLVGAGPVGVHHKMVTHKMAQEKEDVLIEPLPISVAQEGHMLAFRLAGMVVG